MLYLARGPHVLALATTSVAALPLSAPAQAGQAITHKTVASVTNPAGQATDLDRDHRLYPNVFTAGTLNNGITQVQVFDFFSTVVTGSLTPVIGANTLTLTLTNNSGMALTPGVASGAGTFTTLAPRLRHCHALCLPRLPGWSADFQHRWRPDRSRCLRGRGRRDLRGELDAHGRPLLFGQLGQRAYDNAFKGRLNINFSLMTSWLHLARLSMT